MQSLNLQQRRLPASRQHRAPSARTPLRLAVTRAAVAGGTAAIIDGKQIAADIRKEIAAEVAQVMAKTGKAPGLAVVLVGSRKDSETYVRCGVGWSCSRRRSPSCTPSGLRRLPLGAGAAGEHPCGA
jgi:hypothetical protein